MLAQRHVTAVVSCLVVVLLWVVTLTMVSFNQVRAVELTMTSVRLERQQAAVSPGKILVQFRTDENVTEDGVQVTIGQAWTQSAVANDYTISTAGLPVGVVAPPGFTTASSVVGKTVTFPVADLNAGVTYGFYLMGGIASNPAPGSGFDYVWTIATLEGGVPSSSQEVGVPVLASDQITINATVGPTIGDYDATLSTAHPLAIAPGDVVTYTITYRSTYSEPSPVTIQAAWLLGTLAGGAGPTVPVFEYIDGSASQAYGSTEPIIDLNNRTISWSIPAFPTALPDQTVTFQLRVASVDTGGVTVTVPVVARISQPVTTPDSSITHTYQYSVVTPTPVPSPTATPPVSAPTNVPTSVPTATPAPLVSFPTTTIVPTVTQGLSANTPTPTEEQTQALFQTIAIAQVTNDSALLDITLSQASTLLIMFGTDPNTLSQQVSLPTLSRKHTGELTSLLPGTRYYFVLQATKATGQVVRSNIYQFSTALEAVDFDFSQLQTVVTSGGVVLYNWEDATTQYPVVIPVNTPYEVSLSYPLAMTFAQAYLIIRDLDVNKDSDGMAPLQVVLSRTKPNTLNAIHSTGSHPARREMLLRIEDTLGTVRLIPLFSMIISPPLTVVAQEGGQPIEHAQVVLYRYDPVSQLYSKLPAPALLEKNPLFSLSSGIVRVVVPAGSYRAEVSVYGYHSLRKDFSIGGEAQGLYPTIELSSAGWNVLAAIKYYAHALKSKIALFSSSLLEVQSSRLVFDVLALTSLATAIWLSYLSLATKMGVSLRHLPRVLVHRLKSINNPQEYWVIQGFVSDQQQRAVVNAQISVLGANRQVVTQAITDARGAFSIPLRTSPVTLVATAAGYVAWERQISAEDLSDQTPVTVLLDQNSQKRSALQALYSMTKLTVENIFEILLLATVIVELSFIPHFGLLTVLPFMIITSVNVVMWVLHLYHVHQTRMV